MGGNKRKLATGAGYVNRTDVLKARPRDVCAGIALVETDKSIGLQERRFSRKLLLPGEEDCLVALVQLNDICMMVLGEAVEATSVTYQVTATSISGRKKKVCLLPCYIMHP